MSLADFCPPTPLSQKVRHPSPPDMTLREFADFFTITHPHGFHFINGTQGPQNYVCEGRGEEKEI